MREYNKLSIWDDSLILVENFFQLAIKSIFKLVLRPCSNILLNDLPLASVLFDELN